MHEIDVLFDGDCPLCTKEIRFVQKLDRKNKVRFTDIAAKDFDASALGLTQDEVMSEMHGVLPDGSIVTGVEVFRRMYSAVGLGALLSWTRVPGLSHLADAAYELFARNRLKLTGRCTTDTCEVDPTRAR